MTSSLDFKIDWSTRSKLRGPNERSLGELIRKLRDKLAPTAQGLSISYLDDRAMKRLNREHRGINQTTDVLSFPAEPEKGAFQHLGDLVISLPVADKMSKKLGVSRRRAIETLIIHGFLHLCGYDHEQDKGEMLALQTELERTLIEEEPLQMSGKRGRKPGSKIKVTKEGKRIVVTGRAARAIERKEKQKKEKPAKPKAEKAEKKPRLKKAEKALEPKKGRAKKVAKISEKAPIAKKAKVAKVKAPKVKKEVAVKPASKAVKAQKAAAAPKAPAKRVARRPKKAAPRSGVIA
jgi:probable rRNA maturation factor